MINLGVASGEHVVTMDYFRQLPGPVSVKIYPRPLAVRRNFVSFPRSFLRDNAVDLIHIKNYTVRNALPWVSEHEHGYNLLPITEKRVRLLLSRNCRKLVLYSRYAERTTRELLAGRPESERETIMAKTTIVSPAVSDSVGDHNYDRRGPLTFLFVGNEFIRKGGVVAWAAFERLRQAYDIRLVLVTRFASVPESRRRRFPGYPDYRVYDVRLAQLQRAQRPEVTILSDVPRHVVRSRLMKEADVFLAPTFADSFGVATLEAMAEGLPVVASNVNALPEIVDHGTCGLLADYGMGLYPLDEGSLAMRYSWEMVRSRPDDLLSHAVEAVASYMETLIVDAGLRERMGRAARRRFRRRFSLPQRNERFLELYRRALEAPAS